MSDIDRIINDEMTFHISYIDLFYIYCELKGIEYPDEDLTDEEYNELEKEFESKLTVRLICDLGDKIRQAAEDKIRESLREVIV